MSDIGQRWSKWAIRNSSTNIKKGFDFLLGRICLTGNDVCQNFLDFAKYLIHLHWATVKKLQNEYWPEYSLKKLKHFILVLSWS